MDDSTKPKWWQSGMRRMPSGTIQWRFYIDTPTGAKQVSVYGTTRAELKQAREGKERQFQVAPERITLNELLDRYIEYRRQEGADARNVSMTSRKFEKYIRPQLGRFVISELCTKWTIIGDVFDRYKVSHPNSRTVQIAFDEMKRAFKFAIYKGWCSMNPCLNCKRPSYQESEPVIFSSEQIYQLLNLAEGQDRMMIFTLAMTTLRPSELWGIKRGDLDLQNGILDVVTFVTTDAHGNKVEKRPESGLKNAIGKTKRSRRQIPLLPALVEAFRVYLNGKDLAPDEYVFPGTAGKLIHDSGWRRNHFKPLVAKIGLPHATPYDLRHSANSFLADMGVPADMRAAICGHSPEVNLRVYTHFSVEAMREALSNLQSLFGGAFAAGLSNAVPGDKAKNKATKGTEVAA